MTESARGYRWPVAASRLVAMLFVAMSALLVAAQGIPPTFRAAVDLIVLDVQVVDAAGRPIRGLLPSHFEVTIDGRRRDVLAANLMEYSAAPVAAPSDKPPFGVDGVTASGTAASAAPASAASAAPHGRFYVLAVDTMSFNQSVSRGMVTAAKRFLAHLRPDDVVGVYAYPTGPSLDPTTDHSAVARTLDRVIGARDNAPTGQFTLRPSEIVDIATSLGTRGALSTTGADADAAARECGGGVDARPSPQCLRQLQAEVSSAVGMYEAVAQVSLGGLRRVIQRLGSVPGRKTLVLMTAGMLVADRAGGRPDLSAIATLAGQDAARSNVTIYTVYVDQHTLNQNSAETRSGNANRFSTSMRDSMVMSHWFDQFSDRAGGALIRDAFGHGERGFDQVLQETSAFYQLAVAPSDVDRDSRPHSLDVKVRAKRATLRGRSWVIIPVPSVTPSS